MNISDRIQFLRKAKGITQEELADAVGVSRQAVSKWEAEQSMPDLERVVAMAEYFDVTTDYILRGTEPVKDEPRSLNARTAAVMATALNAAGLITGAALWYEYQNALGPALLLILQLTGTAVWVLHRDGCPRWFWAVNVWLVSLLPSVLIGALFRPILSRAVNYYYAVSSLGEALFSLLYLISPFVPWAIFSGLVTRRVLKHAR